MSSSRCYFVSGHLDLSEDEFIKYYLPRLEEAISNGCIFVVGDARGCDSFTQEYLYIRGVADNVVVYHMFDMPRCNKYDFETRGGFKSDLERDSEMTRVSDMDIAYIRGEVEQRAKYGKKYKYRVSGTQKNLDRRNKQ